VDFNRGSASLFNAEQAAKRFQQAQGGNVYEWDSEKI
jgi:nitrous oxide reductase accessory protein NosL